MVVYWAEGAKTEYQDFFSAFLNPTKDNEDIVHDILEKLTEGQYIDVKDIKINKDQKFYVLCLSPNAARLSVRFFYENSFGNMLENLEKHYQRLNIPKLKKDEIDYLGSMICYKRQSIKEPKTKRLLPIWQQWCWRQFFRITDIRQACILIH